jgi:glycine/D-amino acid oxidase-like deaminating enzyme
MWTAFLLAQQIPPSRIVVLDSQLCGTGPSGRNGGFVNGLAESADQLERAFGRDRAAALVTRSSAEVAAIGEWASRHGVDAGFRQSGELIVSSSASQDEVGSDGLEACARLGLGSQFQRLTVGEVRERCDSPVFRAGMLMPGGATVHPGRLALGLRSVLLGLGVRLFENSQVRRLEVQSGRAVASGPGGVVRAKAGVIAAGVASASWPGLKNQLTMTSSHMVITEPVPDLLEQLGWTGGEAIIDGRTLVHYFRTTDDGRIAFGWGGGRISGGSLPSKRESVDRRLRDQVRRDLIRFFPALSHRRIEHAWGGPIDAAPNHLPGVRSLGDGVWHAAFGYTGNGVGPSRLCADVLCRLSLDRTAQLGELSPLVSLKPQRVPPEPFRRVGGSLIMRAIDRSERADEAGARPSVVDRLLSVVPDRLGYSVGR